MVITQWPAEERPREKLLARGPKALSDAELLAIFLRTGIPGKTAVDLARDLLSEFGGLQPLVEADQARFCAMRGLGMAKYAQLQAAMELGRRYVESSLRRTDVMASPQATADYLTSRLRGYPHEVFA